MTAVIGKKSASVCGTLYKSFNAEIYRSAAMQCFCQKLNGYIVKKCGYHYDKRKTIFQLYKQARLELAALKSAEALKPSHNSQSVTALKYVEERLSILQNPDAIIKKNVDWYYSVQLCKDIIQRLNAEAALHT
jgi:hypothetical protein